MAANCCQLLRCYFALLVCCIISLSMQGRAQQIITVPNQNGVLNDYLCGNLTTSIESQTVLELDPLQPHIIPAGQFCVFQDQHDIILQSSGGETATIACEGSGFVQSGLGFVSVTRVTIRNIQFENCGGIIVQNSRNLPSAMFAPAHTPPENAIRWKQQAVLAFSFCTNVTLTSVSFNNYRGYAVYAVNLYGETRLEHITITSSWSFRNDISISSRPDLLESGSGLYFHFLDVDDGYMDSNVYITDDTSISNNHNVYPLFLLNSLRSVRLQNQPEDFPLSGGAAVTMHVSQKRFRVRLNMDNVETKNNMASTGGSIKVISRNTINNFDLSITNCSFINSGIFNYSDYFEGAGLQMYFDFFFDNLYDLTETPTGAQARIVITNCTFERNSAKVGGAMAIFCEPQNVSEINVELKEITFIENEASTDGDCIVAQREQSAYYQTKDLILSLENIRVVHGGKSTNIDVDRSAAFSFVNLVARISGTKSSPTVISNGGNSAIKAYNTQLFISNTVQFDKNSGLNGGAIALEANSFLFFEEPSNVVFSNNRASKGGAIFSDFTSGYRCVMQFTMPRRNYTNSAAQNYAQLGTFDFNITFIDNIAEDGNSTYAQPIFNCSWYSESVVQIPSNQVEDVYSTFFRFVADGQLETYQNQMRSYPHKPCFCTSIGSDLGFEQESLMCDRNIQVDSIQTYPGKSFIVDLIPVDYLSQPLRSLVEARVVQVENNDIHFGDGQRRVVQDFSGSSCYRANYTLYNAENVTVSVKLSSLEGSSEFVEVNVDLLRCPFGFELNNNSGKCECIALYTDKSITCDIENGLFTKTDFEGGIFWFGFTEIDGVSTPGYAIRCPEGYCKRINTFSLTQLNTTLCIGNRDREICGQCRPGLSMKFGTTDCGYCSNYWLFTLPLYMIAGLLMVIFLFLLRMTISAGTLIAVIFYAQLFSINLSLLAGTNQIRFATVFISLLNLELGFPICFYRGMDFAGKIGFQFAFPIYLWLLVGLITYLCRHSRRLSCLIGPECVKVFVTLFYLSYTKLVRTIFEVFTWAIIDTAENKQIVWFFDGSVQFFTDWRHLLLVLVSLIMYLVVITPYKFFLFLSQWCLRSSWISRHFKPLIDANIAPFKDRWRFWLGMRLFLTEILILVSIVFTSINPKIVAFTHVAVVMTLMLFQAYIKPYKSKLVNILDLFFVINFLLFVTSCVFLYVVVFTPGTVITASNPYLFAVEILYVGSAFVVFVAVIIYHVVERVMDYRNKRGRMNVTKATSRHTDEPQSIRLESSHDSGGYTTTEIHSENFVGLREPLLED